MKKLLRVFLMLSFFLVFLGNSFAEEKAKAKEEGTPSVNIGGDFNFRYRENADPGASSPGFNFYEFELFIDSNVNSNLAIFGELPIYHSNAVDLGNAWADIHFEGELAATGYTGLMIGHFAPWFGYYGYDDNQSWIYGGRTTTNSALVRNKSIDGLVIRHREVGIALNLKLGPFLLTPQIYNGTGPWRVSGGSDNDSRKDVVVRGQYELPEELGVLGVGYWNAPKTFGATANSGGTSYSSGGVKHVRDVERYVAYFKFPDVEQATVPDISLGGKPFVIYGECIYGIHKGNPAVSGFTKDQKFLGGWIETNINIIRDNLVGVLRFDYYDANMDSDPNDYLIGLTPTLKWQPWSMVFYTLGYEYYDGGANASSSDKKQDRLTIEMSIQF